MREIARQAQGDGHGCAGSTKETAPCNLNDCPHQDNAQEQDLSADAKCEFGDYTPWTNCTAPCGGGQMTRERPIIDKLRRIGRPVNGGDFSGKKEVWLKDLQDSDNFFNASLSFGLGGCAGALKETTECNFHTCAKPVDCVWSEWEEWGSCSKSCWGTHKRSRKVLQSPKNGGKSCTMVLSDEEDDSGISGPNPYGKGEDPMLVPQEEVKQCNMHKCTEEDLPKMYCKWDEWEDWGECDEPCGWGIAERKRHLIPSHHPAPDGLRKLFLNHSCLIAPWLLITVGFVLY